MTIDRPSGQDIAALNLQHGQRIRVTFEAEVVAVSAASGRGGVALIRTAAGAGMTDALWTVREAGFGEVITVEVLDG